MIETPHVSVIDPVAAARWLVERQFIWQMDLSPEAVLRRRAGELGLGFSTSGDDLQRLWQIGLLRADVVISRQSLDADGLVLIQGHEAGEYVYADARDYFAKGEGLGGVIGDLGDPQRGTYLMFHPFRYYVLHRIEQALAPGAGVMQMLRSTDGCRRSLEHRIEYFNELTAGEHFRGRVRRWNEVTSLAVAAEPFTFSKLFGYSGLPATYLEKEEEFDQAVEDHFTGYKEVLQGIGLDGVKKIISEVCREAERLEPNKEVHLMLRLTERKYRLDRVLGRLGGAMHLLAMAETIRRSAEMVFETELPEEDEYGFGLDDGGDYKQFFYGSQRLLDDYKARATFIRDLRLDHSVRLRWYVEGDTELGAIERALGRNEEIEIVNLRGAVAAAKGKGLSFSENLSNDMRRSVYSWVTLDGDSDDNLRVVKRAAEKGEMFGMFFVSDPDFEFANFTLDELVEILWDAASENGAEPGEKQTLEQTAGAKSGKRLFELAKPAVPALARVGKGKAWGERLMRYAWKTPHVRRGDGPARERPIIEAVEEALRTAGCSYFHSRKSCKVDAKTGRIIQHEDRQD
jgi:hypothetical protein